MGSMKIAVLNLCHRRWSRELFNSTPVNCVPKGDFLGGDESTVAVGYAQLVDAASNAPLQRVASL